MQSGNPTTNTVATPAKSIQVAVTSLSMDIRESKPHELPKKQSRMGRSAQGEVFVAERLLGFVTIALLDAATVIAIVHERPHVKIIELS